jgi:hypothetical protein
MSLSSYNPRPSNNYLQIVQSLLMVGLLFFLPPAVYYLTDAVSHSTGLMAASIVIIGILGLQPRNHIDLAPLVTILTLIVIHITIAAMIRPVDFQRTGLSVALLSIVFLSAILFSAWFFNQCDWTLEWTLEILRWVMLLIATLSLAGVQPASPKALPQPVFPFSEPSHFALIMSLLVAHACISQKGWRRFFWLLTNITLALSLQNLSLVVSTIVIAAVCLPIWQLVIGAAGAIGAIGMLDTNYFSARLDFSAHTTNQSALVYLQGWELTNDAFQRTMGWGVGFQNLGLGQFDSPSAETLFRLYRVEANLYDGGFVAAKLLSEFGVFGLALVILYAAMAFKTGLQLRKTAIGALKIDSGIMIAQVFFVLYSIDLFVRGLAYFSASSTVFLASVIFLWSSHKKDNNKFKGT